jgi:hypothetical protein
MNEIDVPNQHRIKTKCRTKNVVDRKVSASSSFMKEGSKDLSDNLYEKEKPIYR